MICSKNIGSLQGNKKHSTELKGSTMENKIAVHRSAEDLAITYRYWETVTKKEHSEPERELMRAVLKDALFTYRKGLFKPHPRFMEVEHWLFEEDNGQLFSFEVICFVLGLNSQRIRHNLLGWKASANNSHRVVAKCWLRLGSRPTERPGKPAASKYNVSPTT